MGLISVAKPMIGDIFTKSMPHLVTASFASAYLMAMAAGNLGGRIGWAGNIYVIFLFFKQYDAIRRCIQVLTT